MIVRYDSIGALRADYMASCQNFGKGRRDEWDGLNWYGNERVEDTVRMSEVGDTSLVPQAEAYLNQLDASIDTPRKVWDRSPAGAYCSVPDYLAGRPTPMRRQVHVADETSPITVFVVTVSSAGIDARTLAKRGTIILALVMALARVRPVTLQQLTMTDGRDKGETIFTAEINTHPLDLATACYVLTSAGFARRMTYDLARVKNDFQGGWPRSFRYFSPEVYYDRLRQELAPDPSRCLVIGAAQLGDELLQTPLLWITKQITRFTQDQEEFIA